jgi:hypothetical protein
MASLAAIVAGTNLEFWINLKAAKTIGLKIPDKILSSCQCDRVMQLVRCWRCAPKARIIGGGRFHLESCRLIRKLTSGLAAG